MKNIVVQKSRQSAIEEHDIEIVERKGVGHPDYITDSVAEAFSRALCKEYLDRFGVILHHNVDKADVVGGATHPEFGGGKLVHPLLVFFSGRAVSKVEGKDEIPIKDIAIRSAKDWIRSNFRFLDPEKHIKYQVETKSGAGNLKDIFSRHGVPEANDTSLGQAYAPMSQTEQLVYDVERHMNSPKFKKEFPFTGEDVKVMGLRQKDEVHLTIASSFIDQFIIDEKDYFAKKEEIISRLYEFALAKVLGKKHVVISLNTLDRPGRGTDGLYLTVTGTSAEMGDDGQVGRGNRVNGVIPYMRPISMEATAGKNPVSHIGKIYNALAQVIADRIHKELPDIREAYVSLLSQIGKPISEPLNATVSIVSRTGYDEKTVKHIVETELGHVQKLTNRIVNGEVQLF